MKTKYTKENEVDFYYRLLAYMDKDGYLLRGHDHTFYRYPTHYTNLVDSDLTDYPRETSWPRETSPETYEYYVRDHELEKLKKHIFICPCLDTARDEEYKHKIKITICEDE